MLPKSLLPGTVGFQVIAYSRERDTPEMMVVVEQLDKSGAVVGVGTLAVSVEVLEPYLKEGGIDAGIAACVHDRMMAVTAQVESVRAR